MTMNMYYVQKSKESNEIELDAMNQTWCTYRARSLKQPPNGTIDSNAFYPIRYHPTYSNYVVDGRFVLE